MRLSKILPLFLVLELVFSNFSFALAQEVATESATPAPTPFESLSPSPEIIPSPVPEVNSNLQSVSDAIPISEKIQEAAPSAQLKLPISVRALRKKNFRANEKVTIVVENTLSANVEIAVFDVDGRKVDVETELVSDYDPTVIKISPPVQFKAGRYRVKITDPEGNATTQDFTWGVLAINTNKSIYLPNETAKMAIAVLDETGMMVCDALLRLEIKASDGQAKVLSTEDGTIKVNPECQFKEFTLTPDYETSYQVGDPGVYAMTLTAETKNGTYSITDSFEARESVSFDIERKTATRLFPPETYPVTFNIEANQDFEGRIIESVPGSFAITPLEGVDGYEGIETVLGVSTDHLEASIFGLVLPFDTVYPINLGFGQQLRDPLLKQKYSDFNLLGHDGIDFDVLEGTPVLAVDDGEVVKTDPDGDYGATVVIQHSWGKSYYGHLSKITTQVGTQKKKGYPIGLSGSTGLSTGHHLHFGIKPNDNDPSNGYYGKINPLPYLDLTVNNQDIFGQKNVKGIQTESQQSPNANTQLVYWDISVKKGDRIKLGYNFKAPNISPQFFVLGPLEFKDSQGKIIWEEARRWQLAIDIDGSGANTVVPTTGTPSSTGNTYTFTFDPSEVMDSGGITITVPSSGSPNWSAPQGTAATAGYTTTVGTGNATVADILNNNNSVSGWSEDDFDMCGPSGVTPSDAPVLSTSTVKEGSGSIVCDNNPTSGGPDNGDTFSFDYGSGQNWSTACNGGACTQVSYWINRTGGADGTAAGFAWGSGADVGTTTIGTPCAVPATPSSGAWVYATCTLNGTLTTVQTYGFKCSSATCNPFETGDVYIDEMLIGPGKPTFSGAGPWDITVRFLDLAAADTVTVTYGSGGGASGVQNSSTEGVHTFTTKSKIVVNGTYANIASHPTITLSLGPTMDQVMRHGKWFNASGVEQPFTF